MCEINDENTILMNLILITNDIRSFFYYSTFRIVILYLSLHIRKTTSTFDAIEQQTIQKYVNTAVVGLVVDLLPIVQLNCYKGWHL